MHKDTLLSLEDILMNNTKALVLLYFYKKTDFDVMFFRCGNRGHLPPQAVFVSSSPSSLPQKLI